MATDDTQVSRTTSVYLPTDIYLHPREDITEDLDCHSGNYVEEMRSRLF